MEQSIRTEFNHQSKEQITLLRGVPRGSLTTPAQTSTDQRKCAGLCWCWSVLVHAGLDGGTSTDQHQHRPARKHNMRWFVLVLVLVLLLVLCWFF